MKKVICMITRMPIESLPLDSDGGKDLLNFLMEYKALARSSMSVGEHYVMAQMIRMVENNSGLSLDEMLEKRSAK